MPLLLAVAALWIAVPRASTAALQRAAVEADVSAASASPRRCSLSEQGGYFDTDNLISNERSYLQVIPDLRRPAVRGGAYIGVGPDQNFSYIARCGRRSPSSSTSGATTCCSTCCSRRSSSCPRPESNTSRTCSARPLPPPSNGWRQAPIDRLVGYIEKTPASAEVVAAAASADRKRDPAQRRAAVGEDLATIDAFHRRFIDEGLALRFNSTGRPPQAYYPTYSDLLLETDAAGSAGELPRVGGGVPVRQVAAGARPHRPGDWRHQRAVGAAGDRPRDRRARRAAVGLLRVERRVLPVRAGAYPRFVTNLRGIPRARPRCSSDRCSAATLPSAAPATPASHRSTPSTSCSAATTTGGIGRMGSWWRAESIGGRAALNCGDSHSPRASQEKRRSGGNRGY